MFSKCLKNILGISENIENGEGEAPEGPDNVGGEEGGDAPAKKKKKKKNKNKKSGQTDPPTIAIVDLFTDGNFPLVNFVFFFVL